VLRVGERHSWAPPNHGAGGYRWYGGVTGDVGAVRLTVDYAGAGEAAPVVPGPGRAQVVHVDGRAPGEASVVLVERRSWEDDSTAIAKQVVDVRVVAADNG
jgi:hypothetical protein